MEITFAIIGTAGRESDGKRLDKNHYKAMCTVAEELLVQFAENNYPVTTLVSGGAAWADHVAVHLFLKKKAKRLRLYLPCEWDTGGFKEAPIKTQTLDANEKKDKDPARTLNYYHKQFFNKTLIHSLSEIQSAKNEGAELLPCRGGFFGRNAMVAKSDLLLAMTFGKENEVKDGGTCNTVKVYLERVRKGELYDKSFHFDLNSGKVFAGCTIPKLTEQEKLIRQLKHKIPGFNSSNILAVHSYPP